MIAIQARRDFLRLRLSLLVLVGALGSPLAFSQSTTPNPGNPSTLEDFKAGDANAKREAYQRATDILKELDVSRGDRVADLGAGGGYYSMRVSDVVGPTGKVFAEDISDNSMRWLHQRVKVFDLRNVEVVKGEPDNPKLPADSFSAVLVVNSYHHFEQYQAMDEQILRILKPGGRLVIADYSLPAHRTEPRADQIKSHEIDPNLVREELTRVGFHVLKCDDPFLKRMTDVTNGDRIGAADMWLIVAVRPN
jgi:predicted methyltransferase